MISTGEGAKQEVLSELEGLGLNNIYIEQARLSVEQMETTREHRSYGLTWDDIQRLRAQKYIELVAGISDLNTTIFDLDSTMIPKIIFASSNYQSLTSMKIRRGRFLLPEDTIKGNLVCVLGAKISQSLGHKGRIGSYLRIGEDLHKVVGIIDSVHQLENKENREISRENNDEMILLPFSSANIKNGIGNGASLTPELNQIIVKISEDVDVLAASKAIDRLLYLNHNSVKDYQMIVPLELLNQSLKTQAVFNLVLAVIGGISLFVGGIGIMNIMLANVSERKREIGVRRAVGATQKDIVYQFLTESVILTVIGGIIGLLLGVATVFFVELVAGWLVKVTILAVLLPFLLAVFAGIFFGIYPALQAAKLEPIQALRSL